MASRRAIATLAIFRPRRIIRWKYLLRHSGRLRTVIGADIVMESIALSMQVRPRPPLRIWRKNESASGCPPVSGADLPHGVAFRTKVPLAALYNRGDMAVRIEMQNTGDPRTRGEIVAVVHRLECERWTQRCTGRQMASHGLLPLLAVFRQFCPPTKVC